MRSAVIVDSDTQASAIAAAEAAKAGYQPHVYSTAAEAIREAPALRPQLYLVEVKLIDGLGYQVARAIRKHPNLYRAEVLLTSDSDEPRDIEYGLHEGSDAFLKKPFTAAEFSSKLTALGQLHSQIEAHCPLTGFESVHSLRRELDHLVFREENFALCYLIPKGLSRFRKANEHDRVNAATKAAARIIYDTIRNEGFYETCSSHLGSGHFVIKLETDDWKRFHKAVAERYKAAQGKSDSPLPEPAFRFGAVLNDEHHRYKHSRDMFHDMQNSPMSDGRDKVTEKSVHLHVKKKRSGHEHWAG